jgi:hypothetical protein
MKYIFFLLLSIYALGSAQIVFAQQETDDSDTSSGVLVHADPRLDMLIASNVKSKKASTASAGKSAKVIRSGRGFRVQIYNGNDKNIAISKKIDFIRRFPGIKTYMTYIQPQFRVKVGDFQTRREAQEFMAQIGSLYSPVMVVPDIIVINTFNKHEGSH